MTDRSSAMACSPQKSEQSSPSLISPPSPTDHNHHGHPLKVHEGDKTKVGCSKSYNVEEYNHDTEQLNGCMHIYSDTSVHNPNVLTCPNQAGGDDHDSCLHTSISNSLSALNKPKSCLEKVNGLTHTVAEHSSCDSRLIVNLLNNSTSETEELQSSIIYNVVSNQESEKVHHVRKGLASYDEVETVNGKESSYEVPCNSEHCDCLEGLATKLGKTSLHEHSNSSELLTTASTDVNNGVAYVVYESEKQMPDIMRLITKDLSEPYSIYTYRYFIHNWPKLCILAMVMDTCVGAIVCKLDLHKKMVRRGYIAMLAVDSEYRRRQIGSTLVTKAIEAMMRDDCDEVVLETEITNEGALRLYENLGFVRDKRLFRYYLNGVDALRLKLWLR